MNKDLYPRSRSGCGILSIIGWVVAVALGVWLVWYGFTWNGRGGETDVDVTPSMSGTTEASDQQVIDWPTVTPPPATPTNVPTDTPVPSPTQEPTPVPTTATPATIVAGADGVNVRTGPSTSFTRLGYLEPGTQARLIGKYEDWWQIEYDGSPAWVFGELVTASNADSVSQVQPPPSPVPPTAVPATAAPTAAPPTAAPSNYRGVVAEGFQVEKAPGPYANSSDIWFNFWVKNTGERVEYAALGVLVEETGDFQKSWMHSSLAPGQKLTHRDHINQFSLGSGTYHLWLTICFEDGQCFKMLGPTEVVVQ